MKPKKEYPGPESAKRARLPHRRFGHRIDLAGGVTLSTGEYTDGTLGEIFLTTSKDGTYSRAMMNAFAMAMSLGLQHGIPLKSFAHTFRGFRMDPGTIEDLFTTLDNLYGEKAERKDSE